MMGPSIGQALIIRRFWQVETREPPGISWASYPGVHHSVMRTKQTLLESNVDGEN